MVRLAICACWTMVRLPVLAGTVKVTSSPTRWVPNFCTWAAGNALSTTGRTQAGSGQAASGTQVSASVAQQPYPWRHWASLEQVGVHTLVEPIGVQAPLAPQAEASAQAAVQ